MQNDLQGVANIGLNFLLIPVLGMMGAAWATVGSFAFGMVGAWLLAQRFYPVEYEYSRLVKIVLAGLVVWALATRMPGQMTAWSWAWHCLWAICGFPLALGATRFLTKDEISALLSRVRALFGRVNRPGP